MAVNSSNISATDLDFEGIADNIKTYLKGQDKFKDYDFEGSTMSVLIDTLAYASHIAGVNTNIAASELFLDSAQIRKNVVSRAKDLGFIPATEKASSASISVDFKNARNSDGSVPTTTAMIIPRGHKFNSVFDGVTYEFVCAKATTPTVNNADFHYDNIDIVQGKYVTDTFVFDTQIKNPKFVLSNERVDRSRIIVSVNSNGVTDTYSLSTDVSSITASSKVYYTQENEEGFLELYFGDGVLGKKLKDGDVITVTYIRVDEQHADGAKIFSMVQNVNGFSNSTITTLQKSEGGAERESIESIKFKATKFYTSQNRLVTLNDYKAKVKEYYPNADAVAVWGGEDNDPPEYGKVFVSLKPQNSDYLSTTEKADVQNKLNNLNMLTVRPVIVDPSIVKILVSTVFKYNEGETTLSRGELEAVVRNAIIDFDDANLSNFDSIFRHSKLVRAVDDAEDSILSNATNIRLAKKHEVKVNFSEGFKVKFGNALYNPHSGHNASGGGITSSTGFYVSGDSANIQYFDDDGKGNIRRYTLVSGVRSVLDSEAGTINYGTGEISIDAIKITSTVNADTSIEFTVVPDSNDVVAIRGSLIDIDVSRIKVTGEIDTIASGESSAGVGFNTTSTSSY